MKKLLFIPALLWAITLVTGQELFKVPVIPDAEKWWRRHLIDPRPVLRAAGL